MTLVFLFRATYETEQTKVIPVLRASDLNEAPCNETRDFHRIRPTTRPNNLSVEYYSIKTAAEVENVVDQLFRQWPELLEKMLCRSLPFTVSTLIVALFNKKMTTNTAFFCYKDPDIRFTYFCLIDVREYSLKTLPQLENTASAFLTLRVEIHVNI